MTDAAINTEIKTIVTMLKESPFYVTGVTNLDGTHDKQPIDVSMETLNEVVQGILKECPQASFMLIGVGPKHCTVRAISRCAQLNVKQWVKESCGENICELACSTEMYTAYVYGEYPIKQKDAIIANACAFLRKNKLLVEEEDDYHPPFDINE